MQNKKPTARLAPPPPPPLELSVQGNRLECSSIQNNHHHHHHQEKARRTRPKLQLDLSEVGTTSEDEGGGMRGREGDGEGGEKEEEEEERQAPEEAGGEGEGEGEDEKVGVDLRLSQRLSSHGYGGDDTHEAAGLIPEAGDEHETAASTPDRTAAIGREDFAVDPAALLAELGPALASFGTPEARWAPHLILECGRALAGARRQPPDMARAQHLLWILNELASTHGDCQQRLAAHFLQALFCHVTATGPRCHASLCTAAERHCSFSSLRAAILRFQEASPWTTFGHVAANSAILEALEGQARAHILDLSNTFCTQWPTLLEALATRAEGAPHLRLTTVVVSRDRSAMKAMREVGARMEKFARLMGLPSFEFSVQRELDMEYKLHIQPGEALAINCNQALHHVPICSCLTSSSPHSSANKTVRKKQQLWPLAGQTARDGLLHTLRSMNPKVLTLVEDEVDLVSGDFLASLTEALRFYSLYFESLAESFPRVSNERLMLERAASRSLINLLAKDSCCSSSSGDNVADEGGSLKEEGNKDDDRQMHMMNCEKRESSTQWESRLNKAGFSVTPFSDDAVDDVRALLKRYKEGWGLQIGSNPNEQANNRDTQNKNCFLFLTWKDQNTIFASAWKPSS